MNPVPVVSDVCLTPVGVSRWAAQAVLTEAELRLRLMEVEDL